MNDRPIIKISKKVTKKSKIGQDFVCVLEIYLV